MFKIGDRVKYISKNIHAKWLYNRPGIVIDVGGIGCKVKYKEKLYGKDDWWIYKSELKLVIPEYIRIWKKKLDV